MGYDDELDDEPEDEDDVPAVPRSFDPAAAERWARLKRRAGEGLDRLIGSILDEAARNAWGRGLIRRRYAIVAELDEAAWRAYRYLGSVRADEHQYLELGVLAHLDPDGNVIGFGIDNGIDFLALHDVSDDGLRRGLEYMRRQRQQVRRRQTLAYDHQVRPLKR